MSDHAQCAQQTVEVLVVDLGNGHLASVWTEPGGAHFFGELVGSDHDTGAPWHMGFSLPRSAALELAVPQLEAL
jgi:hypothetical protein